MTKASSTAPRPTDPTGHATQEEEIEETDSGNPEDMKTLLFSMLNPRRKVKKAEAKARRDAELAAMREEGERQKLEMKARRREEKELQRAERRAIKEAQQRALLEQAQQSEVSDNGGAGAVVRRGSLRRAGAPISGTRVRFSDEEMLGVESISSSTSSSMTEDVEVNIPVVEDDGGDTEEEEEEEDAEGGLTLEDGLRLLPEVPEDLAVLLRNISKLLRWDVVATLVLFRLSEVFLGYFYLGLRSGIGI